MSNYTYRGYKIALALHPTPLNPNRKTWDIWDGKNIRRGNIATIETAKHVIDTMIQCRYWPDRGVIK